MQLYIQDPNWDQSDYFLERILEASNSASCGGGAFAFASLGGVNLLLHDAEFQRFLKKSSFDLVVGIDAVTTLAALDSLAECEREHKNLSVRAFMSEAGSSLFHPKFCWFGGRKGSALVGSGNLTAGGLRGNREAFTILPLNKLSQVNLVKGWNSWLEFNAPQLYSSDNPVARQRAAKNKVRDLVIHEGETIIKEDRKGKISVGRPRCGNAAVLIAEIPKSGNRWNQANFDIDTFQNFFGAESGRTQRIILTHVDSNGAEGQEEIRPSVAVSSQNYRFELDAGAGLPYPKKKRPIGVFVRVATRTFRYRLFMPGSASHSIAENYLIRKCTDRGRQVGRYVASLNTLKKTVMQSVLQGLT